MNVVPYGCPAERARVAARALLHIDDLAKASAIVQSHIEAPLLVVMSAAVTASGLYALGTPERVAADVVVNAVIRAALPHYFAPEGERSPNWESK
jgi:hypothetical protein